MKPTLALIVVVFTLASFHAGAQTTYYITSNVSTTSYGSGVICTNCNIVISPGVTVTINNNCSCNTCTFSGGTISIVPGSSFTLNGVDSFKNETVLLGQSFNMNTLVFYGDTVAFNTSMNLSNGRTDIDSSRVSVNAALTLNKGTIYKDSLHLNSNLTFTNSVDTFAYSNIDVASGVTISASQSNFINSTFGFAGSSSMSIANGMTSTGSNYYLGGTSTLSSSTTTLSGDNIVMSGSTNSFSTTNTLTTTNTNITMNSGTSSTLSANSLIASGGSITAATGSVIHSTNAINFSGTAITMSGASSLTGNSGNLSAGANLTISGTSSVSVTNAFNVTASNAYLNGNATLSSNSMSISGGSYFKVGDGTLASSADVNVSNGFSVDNTSMMGIANNKNYLYTTNNSLKNNTISCGGGGSQHACTTGYVYGCGTIQNNAGVACTVLATADMSLSATAAGPGQVALTFTDGETATADRYLIQRNTGDNEWNTLATISAGGYTSGEYRFTDAGAPAGTIEYRVERLDQNGKTIYSSIASINVGNTNAGIGIHPNPATGGAFFITTPYTGEMVVNVFTMTGQLLLRTALKGQTQYALHLPIQPSSLGSVVVQTISQAGTRTFTLLVH